MQEEGPVLLTLFKGLPSIHPQHPVPMSPHFQTNSGINSPLYKWPFGLKVTSHGQLPSPTREKPRLPQDPCPLSQTQPCSDSPTVLLFLPVGEPGLRHSHPELHTSYPRPLAKEHRIQLPLQEASERKAFCVPRESVRKEGAETVFLQEAPTTFSLLELKCPRRG